MTFDEQLTQIINQLQRQGRVSYGALKHRYDLDDAYLEDLKDEIIHAQQLRGARNYTAMTSFGYGFALFCELFDFSSITHA